MAQSDFCSLTFSSDEDDMEFGTAVQHPSLSRSGSLSKIVDDAASDYVPKNYIQPEVLSLIAAWEAAMNTRIHAAAHVDTMDVDSNISNMTEDMPPPKRYYLTMWRSIIQRVLQDQ